MAKATQLADGDQEEEVPSQDVAHPDQKDNIPTRIQSEGTEKATQDPPIHEEKVQDPLLPLEVVLVEEENDSVESGVLAVEKTPNESVVVEEAAFRNR